MVPTGEKGFGEHLEALCTIYKVRTVTVHMLTFVANPTEKKRFQDFGRLFILHFMNRSSLKLA